MTLRSYKRRPNLKFRGWVELEEKKEKVIRAVEEGSPEFAQKLILLLSTALHLKSEIFLQVPWWDCIRAFNIVINKNAPRNQIPLIVKSDEKQNSKPDAWDYAGRAWQLYSHLLAKTYGWTLEYIAELDTDDALAKIQEILTSEQLDREFLWSMSEVAYPYDAQTKTNRFKALPRPYWMMQKAEPPKRIKIPKAIMPVGNIDYSGIDEETKPKEIKH